jgi:hypothetical protein
MPERSILVLGSGVAARCCLQLLQRQGASVAVEGTESPKLPAILINPSAQSLLADIFQAKDLFDGLPRIQKRIVLWSSGSGGLGAAEPVVVPHSGVVASEQVLLERLKKRAAAVVQSARGEPGWTIFTGKAGASLPREMHFGSRLALVGEVELTDSAQQDACWVESVESGWLFLLATGHGRGSLISVGGSTEELLEKSRLVAQRVGKMDGVVGEFAAYPRITSSLCADGWLACGAAAMSFDPLCGEGAGNAAREAILACAAVNAILAGESAAEVLAEYSLRLMLGFLRHLENCREFYVRSITNAFWSSELRLIEEGIAWTRSQLNARPRPRFRLVGFGFERIAVEEGG